MGAGRIGRWRAARLTVSPVRRRSRGSSMGTLFVGEGVTDGDGWAVFLWGDCMPACAIIGSVSIAAEPRSRLSLRSPPPPS